MIERAHKADEGAAAPVVEEDASRSDFAHRTVAESEATRQRGTRASLFERYAGVLVLLAMVVLFSILLPGKFMTYRNIIGVVSAQAIGGLMALAVVLPLASGVFDISVAGMMSLAIVGVTWLFQTTTGTIPIALAIAIVLVVACLAGAFNALLVLKGRVDPFIGTIGTGTMLLGISYAIANGATISRHIPVPFTELARGNVLGVPITVFYFIAAMALMWYVLESTPFGRRVYATGAGREASRLAGVRTDRVLLVAFVAAAFISAAAGVIFASSLGAGPPNLGSGFLLPAYASAFLGSTMIRPGRFNVPGLVIALFILGFGINGLQLAGVPFWITDIYQGGVLIAAVLLAKLRSR